MGAESELAGDGQFFALFLEREYIGKHWAAASPDERSRYDVSGAHDPFLFHLAAEATARLRREQALGVPYFRVMKNPSSSKRVALVTGANKGIGYDVRPATRPGSRHDCTRGRA